MIPCLHIQFSSKARLVKRDHKEHKLAKALSAVLDGVLTVIDVLLNVSAKISLFSISPNFEVTGTESCYRFSCNYWTNCLLEKVDFL